MAKRRIIIKGNVQGVGYRAFVRWFANDLGVTGRVKNLPDQSVEIYCEGDAKALEDFIKAIDVKSKDMHMLKISVKSMKIYEEGTKEYFSSKAPKRSQDFEIYYGPGLKLVDKAAMERDELIILAAQDLSKRVDGVGDKLDGVSEKLDGVGNKVDTGFKSLGQKVDGVGQDVQSMHGDMNKSFIEMDGRYHSIGENLEKMNENVKGLTDAIKELVEDNTSDKRKRKDPGTGQT